MKDPEGLNPANACPSGRSGEGYISGDVLVGGQAVIEGVMMRTPNACAVAVRRPDGSIVREGQRVGKPSERHPFLRWPVLRGVGILGQALVLGIRALNYSANIAAAEEDRRGGEENKAQGLSGWMIAGTMAFSALLGAALFIALPLYLAGLLRDNVSLFAHWLIFNMADGIIRLLIFLGYIVAMMASREIRRVFEYHGAEHKVVYNWESGKELSAEVAAGFSRLHPRCGTSFLLVVMTISILVFSLVKSSNYWILAASRLVLMPLIAGLSYELVRWSARQKADSLIYAAFKPGLALQRLTTREPDEKQLEVAIAALRYALELEKDKSAGSAREAAA